jgi:ABC-type nickel/cobalt efflux system permease component RcnA
MVDAIRMVAGLALTVAFLAFLFVCGRELVQRWKRLSRPRAITEASGVFVVALLWIAASFVVP